MERYEQSKLEYFLWSSSFYLENAWTVLSARSRPFDDKWYRVQAECCISFLHIWNSSLVNNLRLQFLGRPYSWYSTWNIGISKASCVVTDTLVCDWFTILIWKYCSSTCKCLLMYVYMEISGIWNTDYITESDQNTILVTSSHVFQWANKPKSMAFL